MSDRSLHRVPDVELELRWLEAHGWIVTDSMSCFEVTCSCGRHLRWIDPKPLMDGYESRARAWLISQPCNADLSNIPNAAVHETLIGLQRPCGGGDHRRRTDGLRMMWALVVLHRAGAPIHSPAVGIDLDTGLTTIEMCALGATPNARKEIVYDALQQCAPWWSES